MKLDKVFQRRVLFQELRACLFCPPQHDAAARRESPLVNAVADFLPKRRMIEHLHQSGRPFGRRGSVNAEPKCVCRDEHRPRIPITDLKDDVAPWCERSFVVERRRGAPVSVVPKISSGGGSEPPARFCSSSVCVNKPTAFLRACGSRAGEIPEAGSPAPRFLPRGSPDKRGLGRLSRRKRLAARPFESLPRLERVLPRC